MKIDHRALPIYELETRLVSALKSGNRLVIEAPTGSGKSTQVPQMILDGKIIGEKQEIVVLQPRRLAARMLARRVAHERGGEPGGEVGHQIRFENLTGPHTRIRYVTEGVLLRQLLTDPTLPEVGAVIFDEFHERHFYGDVTLARCLEVQEESRPDLKLIVMSATLQSREVCDYLEPCEHLVSEGRTYPVDIQYVPPRERHGKTLPEQIVRILHDHFRSEGKVEDHTLVFLPGTFEIRKTIDALHRESWTRAFKVLPLYGELPPRAQDEAVDPSDEPKIVVTTNVAETSLTIDGVRLVVDSGLARISNFDVRRGIDTLTIEKISRASADQRAGRAGRTASGVCLRLWSQEDHARRSVETPPEIHRMDLSEVVLTLKATGIHRIDRFRWFDMPDPASLALAMTWLKRLGALDTETEALTPLGRQLSKLPVNPRHGRILLEAAEAGCAEFFAVVIAATQTRSIFAHRQGGGARLTLKDYLHPGDTSDFQAIYRAWQAAREMDFDPQRCAPLGIHAAAAREMRKIAKQFMDVIRYTGAPQKQGRAPDGEEVGKMLLTGFSDRVARRLSPATLACAVTGGRRGLLEKESAAAHGTELFIACEMTEVEGKDVTVRLSVATAIEEAWLEELFPHDFESGVKAVYNDVSRRVEAKKLRRWRDLELESKTAGDPPKDQAAELLAREVAAGRLVLKQWDGSADQWVARVNTLSRAMPDLELPTFGEEDKLLVLSEVCQGAFSYKDIKDRQVMPSLKAWLPNHMKGLLDQYVPERVTLSNGRSAKVQYQNDGTKPRVSVMIQHLFDVRKTPTLPGANIPLVVEILAPNQRPVQLTEDLAGFWANSYAAVRAQLRGRYPKHAWPDA